MLAVQLFQEVHGHTSYQKSPKFMTKPWECFSQRSQSAVAIRTYRRNTSQLSSPLYHFMFEVLRVFGNCCSCWIYSNLEYPMLQTCPLLPSIPRWLYHLLQIQIFCCKESPTTGDTLRQKHKFSYSSLNIHHIEKRIEY